MTSNNNKNPLQDPWITPAIYESYYQQSLENPDLFWAEQAQYFLDWQKPWDKVQGGDFFSPPIKWYEGGLLNASFNCLDRHLTTKKDHPALIWEGNEPSTAKTITYGELHQQVCQFANVLKTFNVSKGDRVAIYLPMIPELVIAMLACARIGAIHSVVFGGFSAEALKMRIWDADCKLVITADSAFRGEKEIPFKAITDEALLQCEQIQQVIVIKHTNATIAWVADRDRWYHEMIAQVDSTCPAIPLRAEDPLFILYTSGSTGKPKGITHALGGYLVYVAMSFRYVFNYQQGDIHWCTADIGWITGHSYAVYGPLLNGGTTLLFEGVPHYPSFSRYWEIIDKHQVNIFYTAPTALRALRKEGDNWVKRTQRTSLKLLGSVGEPLNPEVWNWYFKTVGAARCPVINTWWQTETGGIILTQFPDATPPVPGSVGWPFFGISPIIVNEAGETVSAEEKGLLLLKKPWPGLTCGVWRNPSRFEESYLKPYPGAYLTGDQASQNPPGNYWVIGRNDDIIKVSGHRIGTEEVESALVSHSAVSEAAVVPIPHAVKGEAIFAFVTPKAGVKTTDPLKAELIQQVRHVIGPLATPEAIQWTQALPKTRSGKIMRRILKKIACNEFDNLGDLSTLADASVVEQLIKERQ